MNQSLNEAFQLATIQQFSIDMMRNEVADASVDAFAAVSAVLGGSPRSLFKQFSVVWPRRWK
jgi:hypothetical protein